MSDDLRAEVAALAARVRPSMIAMGMNLYGAPRQADEEAERA
jgi:hypothetical protein